MEPAMLRRIHCSYPAAGGAKTQLTGCWMEWCQTGYLRSSWKTAAKDGFLRSGHVQFWPSLTDMALFNLVSLEIMV